MISSQSSPKVPGGGGVVVDNGPLHHQQGAEYKPTNQLRHSQCRVRLTDLKKLHLYSSNGVALDDISVDTLHVVLDDALIQVAQRVVQTSNQASGLHGFRVEAEEIVLTGLQDL